MELTRDRQAIGRTMQSHVAFQRRARDKRAMTARAGRPNARRLIVNADDFGQSAGINEGIIRCVLDGRGPRRL